MSDWIDKLAEIEREAKPGRWLAIYDPHFEAAICTEDGLEEITPFPPEDGKGLADDDAALIATARNLFPLFLRLAEAAETVGGFGWDAPHLPDRNDAMIGLDEALAALQAEAEKLS